MKLTTPSNLTTSTPTGADANQAETGDGRPLARLGALDGWRAISILLVLGCHMLPLGPSRLRLNEAAGVAGMSLFFTLSGFLIVSTLHRHPGVAGFLVRRLFRIVPLAALATLIYLAILGASASFYPPHLLFYVNYDHPHFTELTGHFWSLCVEVHFYVLTALIVAALGLRGLALLPVIGLFITVLKVRDGVTVNIMTHYRADEIMAGATLALIWLDGLGGFGRAAGRTLATVPTLAWLALFAIACHPASGPFQYARPVAAGMLVGHTLLARSFLDGWLNARPFRYIAEISYALYVIHPATMYGWLGSGDTLAKYLKRPICFALSWALAHLSTFKYEHHWIALGKHICRRLDRRAEPAAALAPAGGGPGA